MHVRIRASKGPYVLETGSLERHGCVSYRYRNLLPTQKRRSLPNRFAVRWPCLDQGRFPRAECQSNRPSPYLNFWKRSLGGRLCARQKAELKNRGPPSFPYKART